MEVDEGAVYQKERGGKGKGRESVRFDAFVFVETRSGRGEMRRVVLTTRLDEHHTLDVRLSDVREGFEEGGSEVGFEDGCWEGEEEEGGLEARRGESRVKRSKGERWTREQGDERKR